MRHSRVAQSWGKKGAFNLMPISGAPACLEIRRASLTHALKIVAKAIGKDTGEASLRFEDGQVSIEACGTAVNSPANGVWPVPVFVGASWVRRLAQRMPPGDPVRLQIRDGHIYLERYSEPCTFTPTERPVDSNGPQVNEERLIQEAARILKPLHIKRSDLEELVSETRTKGTAAWSPDEKRMTAIVARAWVLLAPIGD